jgi:hypothetical protein
MPKKGKEPEPEETEPEPEPEPEETPEEKEALAREIVDGMADGVVAERVRDDAARPLAVADVLGEAMDVLAYRFTHHDEGSSVEAQQGETWTMEEEPQPAVLDTWARGSVPVKIRPKLKVEEIDDEQIPAAMSTGRSIRSVRSRGSRASGSRASRRSEGSEKEEKIIVAHSRPVPPKPANKQEERARQNLKELNDKKAAVAAIEAAYADERSRIEGVLEELKGTEYGYNHKGEIIMLESVNTERLPSQDVNLRVGLWSEADLEPPPEKGRKGKKGKGKKKQGRKTPVSPQQSGSITTAGALQGPVADTINMGVGALLRSGENEKRGPPRPKDPMRMSRKDYAKMLQSMGGFEDHGLGDTTKTWDDAKPEGESDVEEEEEEEEVDWMEDARPATPDEEPEADIPQALKNHMEFNQSIVGASDWGMAGAPQAFRPQDPLDKTKVPLQRSMAVGERPRMPRERAHDTVPGIKTSEMKRLPAPVFPASKGHGFGAIGYLGGEKSFVEAAQERSFLEAETTPRADSKTGQSVELPPINGSQGSFASQNRSMTGSKRRSFNNNPPSHVHTLQPQLARKYLGVART